MAIDESELTKGQLRKLNALRRSVGDDWSDPLNRDSPDGSSQSPKKVTQ